MRYTKKYSNKLFILIKKLELELSKKYDGELYSQVQNMRAEYREIVNNIADAQDLYHKRCGWWNLKEKFIRSDWKPKTTYISTTTPH